MENEQNNVNQNENQPMNFLGIGEYSHTKFSTDNLMKKIKSMLILQLLNFINKKISELYNNGIGYGFHKIKLIKPNQEIILHQKRIFNKELLNKTIGEIFSTDTPKKHKNYLSTYNKNLIAKLIEEEDPIKNEYFNGLFNTTFLECLEYFRGDRVNNRYIEGLIKFSELEKDGIFKTIGDDDYIDYLKEYLKCYENIVNSLKSGNKNNID